MTDCVADPQYIKIKAPQHKIIHKSSVVIKEMQLVDKQLGSQWLHTHQDIKGMNTVVSKSLI